MKIPAGQVRSLVERPDPRIRAYLLFGPEAGETDALRVRLCDALLAAAGEGGELVRLSGDAVRRDPASLRDAIGAVGLFGGRPVALVEGAGDGAADGLRTALGAPAPDDGPVVVVAGDLKGGSRLRKLFEGGKDLAALGVYPQPPGRPELKAWAAEAGVTDISPDGMEALEATASGLETPEIRNLLTLLALYRLGTESPATAEEIAACAPIGEGGELEAAVTAAAARRPGPALTALARAFAKGRGPGEAAMQFGRWFRMIHAAASANDGPAAAVARLRPPLYGPRRDALLNAAKAWPPEKAEAALGLVLDAERSLRGVGARAPDRALVERLAVRIATLR
ncbi:MAG: DNA polymerase III subunit delta [Paracoccaceae bacterium]